MASIIFDFDGTIADSFDVIVDIFEHLTNRSEKLTDKQLTELRGYPVAVVAKRLNVSWWRAPWLLFRGRHLMGQRIREIPVFAGMPKVIEQLHAEGHEVFILSSNSTHNVKKFMKQHHLYKYFVEIKGSHGLQGKAKLLKKMVERNNLDIKDCVYVGDETRDVVVSQAVGMRVIAVSWGFAKTEFLESLHPTAMAYKPQDIVTILEEI